MRRIILGVAAGLCVTAFAAAPAHAGGTSPGTIVDVAVAASGGGTPDANPGDYDILVQAVIAADLAGTLSSPGPFTVFAPNDRAFQRLVRDLTGQWKSEADTLATLGAALKPADLDNVLRYHVVAGKRLGPVGVLTSRRLTMANGGTVRPTGLILRDETPALADPWLVLGGLNIGASNGVIHTISRVLVPNPLISG